MKQGHYLTIDKAFQNYWENKEYLTNYPYPHAVNYQKARVKGDCYKNIPEQLILSCIDKVEDIQKQVDLVEETYKYFKHEGQLRDLYIKIIYMNKHRCTNVRACYVIGIDDRTGKRWKKCIFEKAETIGQELGFFK